MMRQVKYFTFFFIFLAEIISGQITPGAWSGILKVQGTQLRVVFNIIKSDSGFTATMDSPDQNVKGISVSSVSVQDSKIKMTVASPRLVYEGTITSDSLITGVFKQGPGIFPLNLMRKVEIEKISRPQDPVPPFKYTSEEVVFENKSAGLKLAGTLTLPKDKILSAVILISGSGPQNRDEEVFNHRPFLVLSDYLTKNGIAVLRLDDRGVGTSEGNFAKATTLDFSTDVAAAFQFLKTRSDLKDVKIGLIGHSEGGSIATMCAAKSGEIKFIVLLACPGIPGDKLLLSQQMAIGKKSGLSDAYLRKAQDMNKDVFKLVKQSSDTNSLKADLRKYLNNKNISGMPDAQYSQFVDGQVKQLTSPWMQYFLKYNPASDLKNVKCPVLAMGGDKDLQVPAAENLSAIKKSLNKNGNTQVKTILLPNLNHLFQECNTGLPSEYGSIEQTLSPAVMEEVLRFSLISDR